MNTGTEWGPLPRVGRRGRPRAERLGNVAGRLAVAVALAERARNAAQLGWEHKKPKKGEGFWDFISRKDDAMRPLTRRVAVLKKRLERVRRARGNS